METSATILIRKTLLGLTPKSRQENAHHVFSLPFHSACIMCVQLICSYHFLDSWLAVLWWFSSHLWKAKQGKDWRLDRLHHHPFWWRWWRRRRRGWRWRWRWGGRWWWHWRRISKETQKNDQTKRTKGKRIQGKGKEIQERTQRWKDQRQRWYPSRIHKPGMFNIFNNQFSLWNRKKSRY